MKRSLLIIFLLFASNLISAQDTDKLIFRADNYFKIRNYDEAKPLYLEAIKNGIKDPVTYYRLAVSYEESYEIDEQVKSIPYFEYAIENGADKLPNEVYYDLAQVYHLDEQIDKAETYFNKYKSTIKNDKKALNKVNRALETVNNARQLIGSARDIEIKNFSNTVNTQYTEYNPVVSADESVMAFTALRPNTGKTRSSEDFIEEVYISYNSSGNWSEPQPINIVSDYNVGTAGLSADGQKMMVFIGGAQGSGNLYEIQKAGDEWSKPVTLSTKINSRYIESTASLTPDGKTMFFASNRPDGYGGFDIYKTEKLESGEWGPAENLGPNINTKYNEDAPFIHPDQWTLFFTSDGHNTMGGRDIFVTRLFNEEWTTPENMGYPINTTANDNYFNLTADGRKGYFSSDRRGGKGGQDIYTFNMPEEEANIPLTMVKGRILDGETMQAIPTTIYMVDKESGQKLDFVYQPEPKTGNYLIILPPAKNYDMIIESDGYLPYTLNINVPGQTYFYELYQEVLLKTIKQFDVVVGQEVEVRNAFYDTHEDAVTDIRREHEAKLIQEDSIDVYELMNDLIEAKDQKGIEYLTSLIYSNNPIDDISFKETDKVESASRVYYYDETDEDNFEKRVIDGKTIFSLPTMYVTEEAERQKEQQKKEKVAYPKEILQKDLKIYFDVAKSDLNNTYQPQLDEIIKILDEYPGLGVQISGYASAEGNAEFNRELSNKRAISVLDYLNQQGEVVRRRIIAKGQGEAESSSSEEGRRVEINIVDLSEFGRLR